MGRGTSGVRAGGARVAMQALRENGAIVCAAGAIGGILGYALGHRAGAQRQRLPSGEGGNDFKKLSFEAAPSRGDNVQFFKDEVSQVRHIVRQLVPHARGLEPSAISVREIKGGITNTLYRAGFEGDEVPPVLVRVFGAEGLIDRKAENATYRWLACQGIAPPFYGCFANGRVEGYFDGFDPLTLDDMADPESSRGIAYQMARLHRVRIPERLQKYHKENALWQQIDVYLKSARDGPSARGVSFDARRSKQYASLDLAAAARAVSELRALISGSNRPEGFCHNDALCGNILRHRATGEIRLIDFEYGSVNYLAFDVANHFCEWAGGTLEAKTDAPGYNGVCDHARFPNAKQQENFLREYLSALGQSTAPERMKEMMRGVEDFVAVVHLYWGLWAVGQAINQAAEGGGDDGFDYMTYAVDRLTVGLKNAKAVLSRGSGATDTKN